MMMMMKSCWFLVWLSLLLPIIHSENHDEIERFTLTSKRNLAAAPQKCVKWGNTFDVSLTSKNVERNCKLPDGRSICCTATEDKDNIKDDAFLKPVGSNYYPSKKMNYNVKYRESCTVSKKYIPSNQELRDLEKSKEISKISSDHTDQARIKALVEYVISPETIKNSTLWLDRVKYYMNTKEANPVASPIDFEFLSRFEVTRSCDGEVETWTEWIEPLTITARHPFAFGRCRLAVPFFKPDTPRTDRSNVDYVLLQSGSSFYNQNYVNGRRINYSNRKQKYIPIRHYMFDAGTSTFDSSLFWFTCGYSQRNIGFDQVYGWEMTLLEPTDYWNRVPPNWKPYWHFHNVPIASDIHHPDSPIRYIRQIASAQDFVAFKLDIDHPDMEMPIALSLLANNTLSSLIDEFFFELHFRCEIMTSCGWGKRVPAESHGLKLDRPDILEFFMNLRRKGIRAHIWP